MNPYSSAFPRSARRILDVGCGDGTLGQAIKAEWNPEVVGITHSEEEAARGRQSLDEVVVADLETFDPAPLGRFDLVICSHVLEHLTRPERWLGVLRDSFTADGTLLVALPNVLFWRQRIQFLRGRFRYTEGGLMDSTHRRFFDWNTAVEMVGGAGYTVRERSAQGGLPGSRLFGPAHRNLDDWAARVAPGFFGFQFLIVAAPAHPAQLEVVVGIR